MGNPKWVTADLLDVSAGRHRDFGAHAIDRGRQSHGSRQVWRERGTKWPGSATVRWCTEKINGNLHAGLEFSDREATPNEEPDTLEEKPADELDCYEVMQLSPNADADTVQRVYRILAQRYHPDSIETGNKEIFLRLCEAHRILSDPQLRAQYDARYREAKQIHWKIFDRAEAAKGPEAEQRKRQGILELLYAKTAQDPERASMTVFDFEQYLGCPREHLEFAMWYLKGKGYVKRGDNGRFTSPFRVRSSGKLRKDRVKPQFEAAGAGWFQRRIVWVHCAPKANVNTSVGRLYINKR